MSGFIMEQVLGMKWLNQAIGRLVSLIGLDVETRLGGSVRFFLFDVIKITVLLCVLIYAISYIQSYFRRNAAGKSWGASTGSEPTSSRRCWAL